MTDLQLSALQGDNLNGHGCPLLDGELGHLKRDVLMGVVTHVDAEGELL